MNHSNKEDERPSMQFYVKDWLACPELASCGLEAQGLWMRMVCMMWLNSPRGNFITTDNKGITHLFGIRIKKYNKLITELEVHRVFSRHEDGTIYCRRMYRQSQEEQQISKVRSEAGKTGMAARWHNRPITEGNNKPITKITASSASASASASAKEDEASKKKEETKAKIRADALSLFEYYCQKFQKHLNFEVWLPNIEARLKKYDLALLKECVDKMATSVWHKENAQQGFELIVSSDKRVEKWLEREKARPEEDPDALLKKTEQRLEEMV